ncbi:MAG: hypothetical protein WDW36_008543 [Sanguina aurantia]
MLAPRTAHSLPSARRSCRTAARSHSSPTHTQHPCQAVAGLLSVAAARHSPTAVAASSTTSELFSTSFYTDAQEDDGFFDLDDILSGIPSSSEQSSPADDDPNTVAVAETDLLQATVDAELTTSPLLSSAAVDNLSPPSSTSSRPKRPAAPRSTPSRSASTRVIHATPISAPAWPPLPSTDPSTPASTYSIRDGSVLRPPPRPRVNPTAGVGTRPQRDYTASPSADNLDAYTRMSSSVEDDTYNRPDGSRASGIQRQTGSYTSLGGSQTAYQESPPSPSLSDAAAPSRSEPELPHILSTRQRRGGRTATAAAAPLSPTKINLPAPSQSSSGLKSSSDPAQRQPFPTTSLPHPSSQEPPFQNTSRPQTVTQTSRPASGVMTGVKPRHRPRTRDLPRLVLPELDLEPGLNSRTGSSNGSLRWISSQQRFVMTTPAEDRSVNQNPGSGSQQFPLDSYGNPILLDLPLPDTVKTANWRVHAAAALPGIYDPTWHASFYELCFDMWPALDKLHTAAVGRSSALSAAYAFIQLCYSSHDWALGESLVLSFVGAMRDHDELFQASAGRLPVKMSCQAVTPLMRVYHRQDQREWAELVQAEHPAAKVNGPLSARWRKSIDKLKRLKEVHPASNELLLAYLLDQTA